MKKITTRIIFFIILTFCIFSTAVYATDEKKVIGDEAVNVIKLLEIANGDQYGNMNYNSNVTRAEFVKMIVNASTDKELASNTKLNISLFPDVRNNHWAASYISVAINRGLVNGYLDGTFKPNNPVTLEEAATIALRLLGYTSNDLIGNYPTVQLNKYSELNLDVNISAVKGEKLTREHCMILIYNVLSAKTKQGNIYCTTLGYNANSEDKLDYSALLEAKLDGPIIVSDDSNIFADTKFTENNNTQYVLNSNPGHKNQIRKNDVVYYSDIINAVYIYRKTATGIVEYSTPSSVRLSGKEYSIATTTAKNKLSFGGMFSETKSFVTLILGINDSVVDVISGDINRISDNDDNNSLISMIQATISKAIYIKDTAAAQNWKNQIPFDTNTSDIFVNGKKADSVQINIHDVIYYSKAFNSLWVYRKTVSGTIEAINTPTNPSQITVSGRRYNIVSSDAAYKLSVYGEYDIGDRVTLVLGIDDECVAISDTSDVSGVLYGVVTACGEKTYVDKNGNEYTADFVTVTDTTNTSFTYEYSNKYLNVGNPVKVAFSDTVSISKLPNNYGKGASAELSYALKNGQFANDCEIIDVNGSDSMKVSVERLSGVSVASEHFTYTSDVLYHELDGNGNIKKLILKNFTGDLDEYGIVTHASNGLIKYKTDKIEKVLSSQETACSIGPARLKKESGTIVSASSLTGSIENIDAVTSNAVYDSKGNEYLCDDNVKVFIKNATSYSYSDISNINCDDYTITAYYDKLPISGGRIRIIVATRKV